MRNRLGLLVAVCALLGMLPGAGPAQASSETRTYVAGTGDLTSVNCSGATAGAPSVGGACFVAPSGTPYVRVRVADASGRPVAGQVYFRNAANTTIAGTPGVVCADRTLTIPPGTASVLVYVSTSFAPLDCALTASPGTTGTITVDWTSTPQTAVAVPMTGSGSANMAPVAHVPYVAGAGWPWPGGSDLEFFTRAGRTYAVTGSYQNGMRIIDVTVPTAPVVSSVYDCKMYQADIQIFERDGRTYVAYGVDDYSRTNVFSACFADAGVTTATPVRYGTLIIDITDPTAPRSIAFQPLVAGTHNSTIDPSGRFLYNSNADIDGAGVLEIFDLRTLTAPRLLKTVDLGPTLPSHDVTFSADGRRAYVAALSSTLVLDTTDVTNPVVLGRIVNPAINIHHQADPITITDPALGERTFLLITDEIGGAEGNGACPGGGIHVYDVTGDLEKSPVPVGFFDLPDTRTVSRRLRCTAHVMRLYPEQKIATIGWYAAGVRVLDLSGLAGLSVGTAATGSVGAGIKQIGWYAFDTTDTWAVKAPPNAFEPDGSFYMFGNDMLRGFDVYRFDGAAPRSAERGRWIAGSPSVEFGAANPALNLACLVSARA